ncbi:bifunctional transcriptional regulator/glucokinase [Massilia terrae]|uniref:Glucokinase n=1 Tax=Massilia terrae TaxID=1811224 RepID=A0ABT2CWG0_9BURK|nr:glucokinase [Massilia terrae]MCS0658306.1 glucokinase [Massilia terrae]
MARAAEAAEQQAFADGPRLVADIGATHARLALQVAPRTFRHVAVLKCAEFDGIVELLRFYLADHAEIKLQHAALAIAYPVSGDQVRMTNRAWEFSTDAVRRELGLATLLIVNDFTALAMAIPSLAPSDLMQVGGGLPAQNAVVGLLGPGTGLGVSAVIPTEDGFVTLGSEGGHVNFAPADEREFAILQYAWREWRHVSNERIISGPGMELIYEALARRNGVSAPPRSAADIISGALEQNDPLCLEVLECFCGMLGGAAANLGVTLGAFGGIFIGGGIVPRMGEWFARSPFRARFEAKGRFSTYLSDIPTFVITTPNPAFHGVASILAEHLRGRTGANTLMERVRQMRATLTPAEQRVAALVLEQPRLVLNEPIADIARTAEVSQPTVIRFCRSLGFSGLAEFKLKFASSLTGAIPVRHSQVRGSDSTHDLSAKVIDNTVSAILKFRDQLDVRAVDRAIELVSRANRVEFYAMGDASVVALDGQHKFFRFRIPTTVYGDGHLLKMAAELLRPGDVVIAVSNSGTAPELLAAMDAARAAGADIIAIGNGHSAMARKAGVVLAVEHAEDSSTFLSMISRILQLLLIDIVSVGISVDEHNANDAEARERRLLISHLDS